LLLLGKGKENRKIKLDCEINELAKGHYGFDACYLNSSQRQKSKVDRAIYTFIRDSA